MAKTKKLPQQMIKVKNYGVAEVNRLAVLCHVIDQMSEPQEVGAALNFLLAKYKAAYASVPRYSERA